MFVEDQLEVRSDNDTDEALRSPVAASSPADFGMEVELGIWLSGIESFLVSGHHSFSDYREGRILTDATKEFRLVHSALQRCSMLTARLANVNGSGLISQVASGRMTELAAVLRDGILLSGGLINSSSLGSGEWKAWSNLLLARFRSVPAFAKLIRAAEDEGKRNLPGLLRDLSLNTGFLSAEHAELALVLPRFGVILKWLDVVERMLSADEPLKPALLIFSRVNEQIFELTNYINSRLERFPNEEADIFSSLDAASYTASIELKKVYSQELAGIAQMRPSPSIYARMETAHSLLKEGFQQILAGFAKLIDPDADIFELFPTFHIKLEQSLTLRRELRDIVSLVQSAEAKPEKVEIEKMQSELRQFLKGTVRFLFYKDTETVERFVEEILITKQNKDLVPILHRFGAYLETLFGQVNLRAVLEKYPFEPSSE